MQLEPDTLILNLSGISNIRVLETLNKDGKMVLAQISRRTGLNYSSTIKALESLCEAGLVQEEKQGSQRFFDSTFRELRIHFKKYSGIELTKK
jgi:predicted transcriptional regulator